MDVILIMDVICIMDVILIMDVICICMYYGYNIYIYVVWYIYIVIILLPLATHDCGVSTDTKKYDIIEGRIDRYSIDYGSKNINNSHIS
jgi:hypothetical protein